jgi:Glyoxalase-like domain
VADLDAAAREFEARHGLASVEGGRHPGWGTANRIVPLGENYLELIAVVDPAEAAGSAFGSWVAAAATPSGTPLGWAVRTDDLDGVAGRLGLTVAANSRKSASGQTLRWRLAGVEQAVAEPSLPIFVEWGEGTPHPGRAAVEHPAGGARLARLELSGDAERLERWLGSHTLPVSVRPGTPAVARFVLEP